MESVLLLLSSEGPRRPRGMGKTKGREHVGDHDRVPVRLDILEAG